MFIKHLSFFLTELITWKFDFVKNTFNYFKNNMTSIHFKNIIKVHLFFMFVLIISINSLSQNIYYVNSIIGNDTNSGLSISNPWQTINKVNSITLYPGDEVKFHSDQTFMGMLMPNGNGNSTSPIKIDNYGGLNRAIINGENHNSCIYLDNKKGFEISNLELINDSGNSPDPGAINKRRGIYASAYMGVKQHLVFKNLYIHKIYPNNFSSSSEQTLYQGTGILLTGFSSNASNFDGVLIEDCEITDVGNLGISISRWVDSAGLTPASNTHHKNITLRNNYIHHTGGSGAVYFNVKDFLIENNIFSWTGFHDSIIDQRQFGRGSCWWGVRCKNGLLQNNEFSHVRGAADSHGAHIDIACDSVIIQYNLSYDNEGGFAEYMGASSNCIYRYNLSINDGWRVKGAPCSNGVKDTTGIFLNNRQHGTSIWFSDFTGFDGQDKVGASYNMVYNNTFYIPAGYSPRIKLQDSTHHNSIFNNVFYVESGSNLIYDSSTSTYDNEFDNNLWYGLVDLLIPFGPNSIYGLDPQFNNVGGIHPSDYKIDSLSPLFNSGKFISFNGGQDYFGNSVPAFLQPDIGYHEFTSNLLNTNSEIILEKNLVYPNPVDQYLTINDLLYGKDFELISFSGKSILKGKLKKKLNTRYFNDGIYFLHILNDKKIHKIIIKNF